jgi:phosphoribosyl 1,2-cyclic phosphodiesterase
MTEIEIVSSGSSANGYMLKSADQILVLELGCKFLDYVKHLNEGGLKNVAACVCSHRIGHTDHLNPSTAKEFVRRGIQVFAHEEVIKEADLKGVSPLLSHFPNKVGGFIIQTFEAPHNAPNYGFLIQTPTNERILFLTDTTGVNLRFRDIDCIMVECNHDDDTLLDNLSNNDVSMSHPEWHLGLEDCIKFCKANYSSSLKQIILIHMSHTNINEQYALESVQAQLPFDNVAVAHKGDVFKIENDDF